MYDAVLFTGYTDSIVYYKPAGAYRIASIIRDAGFTCLVVDHLHAFSVDELIKIVELSVGENTKLIGISTTFLQKTETAESGYVSMHPIDIENSFLPQGKDAENKIVSLAKKISPKLKIVLGGHKANHRLIKNSNIDLVAEGFFDNEIVKLLKGYTIPAVSSYGLKYVCNSTMASESLNKYTRWNKLDVAPVKVLVTEFDRGCIFNCKFCAYPGRGKGVGEHLRSADSIRSELIENYDAHGIKTYTISDLTVNDSPEKVELIYNATRNLPFDPVFFGYTRLDLLAKNPDTIPKLYDSGVKGYYIGVETLTPDSRRDIRKPKNFQKEMKTLEEMDRRYGNNILTHASFIVGLPGDSVDSIKETAKLAKSLPFSTYIFQTLMLYKQAGNWNLSDLDKNYADYGYSDCDPVNPIFVNWKNQYLTRPQARELADELNNDARNQPTFRIPAQLAWGLMNYDYSWQDVTKMKYSDLDWHVLSNKLADLISCYKKLLFSHLQTK